MMKVSSEEDKKSSKDLIGSVQRALNIMELLAREPSGMVVKRISSKLGLNLSTCYHLLNTLKYEGYVIKDPETGHYCMSAKIGCTFMKQVSITQLVNHLTPHVKDLMSETGENAYLSVWDGRDISVAAICTAENTIQVKSVVIGYSEGNHASATGKTILAFLPMDSVDRYFEDKDLSSFSPSTMTDLDLLKENLDGIKHQGYGVDLEEFMLGVNCIAAPVFDARGKIISSIAISLPEMRYKDKAPFFIAKVKNAAESASRSLSLLGYIGPEEIA